MPDHLDAWLTDRLIFDFVSCYIFNKHGLYRDYEGSDAIWRRAMLSIR